MKQFKKWATMLLCSILVLQLSSMVFFGIKKQNNHKDINAEQYRAWKESQAPQVDNINTYTTRATSLMSNEYVEVNMGTNGKFTMGTTGGNPANPNDDYKNLLYDHSSNTPWSSETLVTIDGIEEIFYADNIDYNQDEQTFVATGAIHDIHVKQVIQFETNSYTGRKDQVSIRYFFINNTDSIKNIGARIMLDTELGANDGAPFRLPSIGDVTKEIELHGTNIPEYWQAFDDLQDPSIISSGTFYKSVDERPDKVQFASWLAISKSSYNHAIDTERSVTGDSAIAAYFNPIAIAPSESRSIITYYGLGDLSIVDDRPPLYMSATAPHSLTKAIDDDSYYPNPFYVTAYIRNINPEDEPLTNVKIKLDLGANSPLEFENERDIEEKVIQSLDKDEEIVLKWIIRAKPQLQDTTATTYKIFASADNMPEKSLDLILSLEKLSNTNDKTIKFDIDGDTNTIPAQTVSHGGYVNAPEEPIKDGYIFKGWYPSRDYLGVPWFGQFQTKRLFLNLTLYAKWEQIKTTVLLAPTDYYDFPNSQTAFNDDKYHINDEYFNLLIKGLAPSQISKVISDRNSKWIGSCFGMGITQTLFYDSSLSTRFFQSNAEYVSDIIKPLDSDISESMINYYQLYQSHPDYINRFEGLNLQDNLKKIVDTIQGDSIWAYISIGAISPDTSWGHMIIGYNVESVTHNGEPFYKISIFESNTKGGSTLYIKQDYTYAEFENDWYNQPLATSGTDIALKINQVVKGNETYFERANLQKALTEQSTRASTFLNLGELEGEIKTHLTTNYNKFKIIFANGDTIEVNGDDITSITGSPVEMYLTNITENGNLTYFIKNQDSFIIEPVSDVSDDYKTEITFADSFMTATTKLKSSLKIDLHPSIEVLEDVNQPLNEISLSLSYDRVIANWINVATKANTNSLKLYSNGLDYNISTETEFGTTIKVTGNDAFGNTFYANPRTESTKLLYIRPNGNGNFVVFDEHGNELHQAQITYTAVFATGGGSVVPSVSDLKSGDKIPKPMPNPEKHGGYAFNGWYTATGDEWDFNNNEVSDNITLYAKWEVTPTYDVVFMADGNTVEVITLFEGDNLLQFPNVPSKTGYDAQWEIDQITKIQENKTISAIYTNGSGVVVSAPIVSPLSGTYSNSVTVTLVTNEPNSKIYYTLDGTVPTTASTLYTDVIRIISATTIKAVTVVNDYDLSDVIEQRYIITTQTTSPTTTTNNGNTSTSTRTSNSSSTTRKPTTIVVLEDIKEPEVPTAVPTPKPTTTFPTPNAPATNNQTFSDVPSGYWAYTFVEYLASRSIMVGDGAGKFEPSRALTRAEFAMVIKNGFDVTRGANSKNFADIGQGAWYAEAVDILSSNGIINGDPQGTFRPNATITREEMAIVMNNLIKAKGYNLQLTREGMFSDLGNCSDFGKESIMLLYNLGILNGMDNQIFAPKKTLTRAETSSVVYSLIMKTQ